MNTSTDTGMDRITTLMRDTERRPGQRRHHLGKLDITASTAAICAKLGRHYLADLDDEHRAIMADALADLLGNGAKPAEFTPGSIEEANRRSYRTDATRTYQADDMSVVILTATPKAGRARLGEHTWVRRTTGESRRILAFRLDTMAGARHLLGYTRDRDAVLIASENDRYLPLSLAADIREAATRIWKAEANREMNDAWAVGQRQAAGVFDDKKHCALTHLMAADDSVFGTMFDHVEIDDGIDLDMFHRLESEFSTRWDAGQLPRIDTASHDLRFRKTMRHHAGLARAIGLYSPSLKAIAVDPRHPESLLHEFAHAWDYEHGQASLSDAFAPILDGYNDALDAMGISADGRRYAATPTEVFARLWELKAHADHTGGSFIDGDSRYADPIMYVPLERHLTAFEDIIANA